MKMIICMDCQALGLTETQQDEVMQEYNGNRKLRGEIPNVGSRCISNWDIKIG